MTIPTYAPLAIASVIFVSATMARRLNDVAQPLRLELARKGEEFLSNYYETKYVKQTAYVNFLLNTSFGMRITIFVAFVFVPFLSIFVLFSHRFFAKIEDDSTFDDGVMAARYFELCRLHDRITLANHPMLIPLLEIEILCFMMPFAILRGAFSGFAAGHADRNSLLEIVVNRLMHLSVARVVPSPV